MQEQIIEVKEIQINMISFKFNAINVKSTIRKIVSLIILFQCYYCKRFDHYQYEYRFKT